MHWNKGESIRLGVIREYARMLHYNIIFMYQFDFLLSTAEEALCLRSGQTIFSVLQGGGHEIGDYQKWWEHVPRVPRVNDACVSRGDEEHWARLPWHRLHVTATMSLSSTCLHH